MGVCKVARGSWVAYRRVNGKQETVYCGKGEDGKQKAHGINASWGIRNYNRYSTTHKETETSITDRLVDGLKFMGYKNVEREYPCLTGRVDVVTEKEAIEVKHIRYWKSAIGQAIAYASVLKKEPRVHLFGKARPRLVVKILDICKQSGVRVTFP